MVRLNSPPQFIANTTLEAARLNRDLVDSLRKLSGDEGVIEFRDGIAVVQMDTVTRDSIATDPSTLPASTIIYNIDTDAPEYWDGTTWVQFGTGVGGGGGGGTFDPAQFAGDGTPADPRRLIYPLSQTEFDQLRDFAFNNDDFPISGGAADELKSERSIAAAIDAAVTGVTGAGNAVGDLIATSALPTSGNALTLNWQAPTGGYPSNWTKQSAEVMRYAAAGVPADEVIGLWILSRRGDVIVDKRMVEWQDFEPAITLDVHVPRTSTATDAVQFTLTRSQSDDSLDITHTGSATANFGSTNADSHVEIRWAAVVGRRGPAGSPGADGTPLSIVGPLIATTSTLPTTVSADTFVPNTWTLGTDATIAASFAVRGGQVTFDRDWTPADNVMGFIWIALVNGVEVDRTVVPLTPYTTDATAAISTERRKLLLTDATTGPDSSMAVEVRQLDSRNQRVIQLRSTSSTTLPANTTIEVYLAVAGGAQGIQGPVGPAGLGVPSGGTPGQILAKETGADNDTEWIDNEPTTREDRSVPYSTTQQSTVTDATRTVTDSSGAGIVVPVTEISTDADAARLGITIQSNAYQFGALPSDRDTLLEVNGLIRVGFNGAEGQFQLNWEGLGEDEQGLSVLTSSQTLAVVKNTQYLTTGQRVVNIPISSQAVRVRGYSGGRPVYRLRLFYLPDQTANVGTTQFTLLNTTTTVRNVVSFKRLERDSDWSPVAELTPQAGFVDGATISSSAQTASLGTTLAADRQFSTNYMDMPTGAHESIDAGVARLAVDVSWLDAGTIRGDFGIGVVFRTMSGGSDTYTAATGTTFDIGADDGAATVSVSVPANARGLIIQTIDGASATLPAGQDVAVTVGAMRLYFEAVVDVTRVSDGLIRKTFASGRTVEERVYPERPFVQQVSPYETLPAVPADDGVVAYQTDATRTSGVGFHVSGNNDADPSNEVEFVAEAGGATAQWGYRDGSYGQVFGTDDVAELSWFDRAASPVFTLKIADEFNPATLHAEILRERNRRGTNIGYSAITGRQTPVAMAVRPNGNIYVNDQGNATSVDSFTPGGTRTTADDITVPGQLVGLAFQNANNAWTVRRRTLSLVRYTFGGGTWTSGTTVNLGPILAANAPGLANPRIHSIASSGNELLILFQGIGTASSDIWRAGFGVLVLNLGTGAFIRVMNYPEQAPTQYSQVGTGTTDTGAYAWSTNMYATETHVFVRTSFSPYVVAFDKTDLAHDPDLDWTLDSPAALDVSGARPEATAIFASSRPMAYRDGILYVSGGSFLYAYSAAGINILNEPNDQATTSLTRTATSDEVVDGRQFRGWTLNRRVTDNAGVYRLRLWADAARATPVRVLPERIWRWKDDPVETVDRLAALRPQDRAPMAAIPLFDYLPDIGDFPAGSMVIAPAIATLQSDQRLQLPRIESGFPAVHVAMPAVLEARAVADQNLVQLRFDQVSGEFGLGDDIGDAVDNEGDVVYSVTFAGTGAARTVSMYLRSDLFEEFPTIFVDSTTFGSTLRNRELSSTDDTIAADAGHYTRFQVAVPDFAIARWQTGDVVDLRFYSAYTDATNNTPVEVRPRFGYTPAYWQQLR